MSTSPPALTTHFATLAPRYDVLLCDVWGVVHNGVAATVESCAALVRFRSHGGTVVLITNAPRPGDFVQTFIDKLKVPREAYDAIVSSGDVTRALVAERAGERVFHVGPERDLPIFEGLDVELAPIERADFVVCSGLYDDTRETPQDYVKLIDEMRACKLAMICANPDVVVERGDHLVYCAGAVADLYAHAGGEVIYAGKPYAPIYELAAEIIAERAGRHVPRSDILAIGDGIHTDMAGATGFGLDAVFVASGLHIGPGGEGLDDVRLAELFEGRKPPRAAMPALAW
jgi:HAD superfamily hydrolase (TIGR01459 family)